MEDYNNTASEFNTAAIIELVREHPTARVIFNVNESGSIPRITREIKRIKEIAGPHRIPPVLSTSGAAWGSYKSLMPKWALALNLGQPDTS